MKSAPFIERPACGSFRQKLQLVHREQKTNKIVRLEAPGTNLCGDWNGGHGIESCRPLWQGNEVRKMDKDGSLKAVLHMDEQGPSITTYRAVLKECAKRKNLAEARRLHTLLVQRGMDSHSSLGEHVVSMLIKCGGLEDAVEVFHRLPHRSAFSWTAIISGYTTADQGQEALRMYDCMIREGLQPNTYTLASLLKACGSRGDLEAGKRIHWDVLKYRCESDLFVGTSLVDMYAKCGSIVDAKHVFDRLPHRDVVLWNAMIGAHAQLGLADDALQLYDMMLEEGVIPNDRTFVRLLHACGVLAETEEAIVVDGVSIKARALHKGLEVHADARRKGYEWDPFVGNTLVSMYGKCGSVVDASKVFDGLSDRDVVSWTGVLSAYAQQGQADEMLLVYEEMLEAGVSPDVRSLVSAVQACGMRAEREEKAAVLGGIKAECAAKGRVMHAAAQQKGYHSTHVAGNTLVNMYGKCGCVADAQLVFDELSHRDVVSWTVMLGAYAVQGQAEKAMDLYEQMLEEGVSPDEHIFVSVFQACGMLGEEEGDAAEAGPIKVHSLATGKSVHAELMERKGYDHAGFVGNALVSMYAKCGSILDARSVFDSLHHRDVVSWTAMLAGYAQQGEAEKALELYGQMWHEGECASPNEVTFATVLQACGVLADKEDEEEVVGKRCLKVKALEVGRRIHDDARRTGHDTHVLVGNALVAMYGKCGSMAEAQAVLDGLSERSSSNAVAWTAMIAAHVRQGEWERALELYRHMQDDKGVSPNEVSLLCILQACSSSSCCNAGGILSICGHIRQSLVLLQEHNQQPSLLLSTSLIHAYGRCGSMVDAQAVFDALTQPDVVAWTALIAGYARQGDCSATRRCYQEMQVSGNNPNGVTFLCLLYACSHAGLVDQGVEYLESMPRDHGIPPEMEHYTATVDLLARTGCFTMVGKLLSAMPWEPDLALCLCLLSACRKHGQVVVGKRAFDAAIRLDPRRAAAYVLMFSIYADAGLWDRADEVRQLRLQAGAWKKRPGQSWIEHRDVMYTFSVGDCDLKQEEQLHCLLGEMGAKAGGGG